MNPHYFIAIDIPDEITDIIHEWTEKMQKDWEFKSWVHRQDYHITLAFLGFIEDEQRLELLCEKLQHIGNNSSPFSLKVSHIGTFGREQFPRILWFGVEENNSLHLLRNQVYDACKQCEFSLDPRPFHPHITVAKKWKGEGPIQLEQGVELFTDKKEFQVKSFKLFQTHLLRTPKYKKIYHFPFSGDLG